MSKHTFKYNKHKAQFFSVYKFLEYYINQTDYEKGNEYENKCAYNNIFIALIKPYSTKILFASLTISYCIFSFLFHVTTFLLFLINKLYIGINANSVTIAAAINISFDGR